MVGEAVFAEFAVLGLECGGKVLAAQPGLNVRFEPQQDSLRGGEISHDHGWCAEMVPGEDASERGVGSSHELVSQFGDRCDVTRILVFAFEQINVVWQIEKAINLLKRIASRRDVIGIVNRHFSEFKSADDEVFQSFPSLGYLGS